MRASRGIMNGRCQVALFRASATYNTMIPTRTSKNHGFCHLLLASASKDEGYDITTSGKPKTHCSVRVAVSEFHEPDVVGRRCGEVCCETDGKMPLQTNRYPSREMSGAGF